MICPASVVRYCGEFASHTDSMYIHLLNDHTPNELALSLLAFAMAEVPVREVDHNQHLRSVDNMVHKIEEGLSITMANRYPRQKKTSLDGYLDICPKCDEDYTSQCRCNKSDRSCPNGHHWHHHPQPHSRGPQAYYGEGDHKDECGPGSLHPCEPVVLGKQVNA